MAPFWFNRFYLPPTMKNKINRITNMTNNIINIEINNIISHLQLRHLSGLTDFIYRAFLATVSLQAFDFSIQ